MFKLTLLVTVVISFAHFISPASFKVEKFDNVLGLDQLGQNVNLAVVREGLLIYCINHQSLPSSLNELYKNELSDRLLINLDKIYSYSPQTGCDFKLTQKLD